MTDALSTILDFDPLDTAEKLTGQRYEGSKETGLLGLVLAMQHNQMKEQLLSELDDTTFSNELDRYQRIITERLGFEKVLDVPFTAKNDWDPVARNEHQMFYAHRDGMLLIFDTYNETKVNGAHVYYSWKPHAADRRSVPYRVLSSGGLHSTVPFDHENDSEWMANSWWFGNHDAREALVHKIEQLREHGQFLPQWPLDARGEVGWVWMCHYGDHKDLQYRDPAYEAAIAAAHRRWHELPDWVKTMTGGRPFK